MLCSDFFYYPRPPLPIRTIQLLAYVYKERCGPFSPFLPIYYFKDVFPCNKHI